MHIRNAGRPYGRPEIASRAVAERQRVAVRILEPPAPRSPGCRPHPCRVLLEALDPERLDAPLRQERDRAVELVDLPPEDGERLDMEVGADVGDPDHDAAGV